MSSWFWLPVLGVLAWLVLRRRGLPAQQLDALLSEGAQVVDVRTPAEFRRGHAEGARNIPLDQLEARAQELDPARPVLLCCASGARSGLALSLLKQRGFRTVHNAGPWTALPGR